MRRYGRYGRLYEFDEDDVDQYYYETPDPDVYSQEYQRDLERFAMDMNKDLLKASKLGDVEKVKECIKNYADVNFGGIGGFTPLHHAAGSGFDAIVKLLLEAGADPNISSLDGTTPLECVMTSIEELDDRNAQSSFSVDGLVRSLKLLKKAGAV